MPRHEELEVVGKELEALGSEPKVGRQDLEQNSAQVLREGLVTRQECGHDDVPDEGNIVCIIN